MPSRQSSSKAGRGISVYYSVKNNLPQFYNQYPELSVNTIKTTAQNALDETTAITPMKSGALRRERRVIAYRNGNNGGTIYAQWLAKDNTYGKTSYLVSGGFPYAVVQEKGYISSGPTMSGFQFYTTPGTGPGFMEETWRIIGRNAPTDLKNATQKLATEISVK